MIKKDIHKIDNFPIDMSHIVLTITGIFFSALFILDFPNIYFRMGDLIVMTVMGLMISLPMLSIGLLIRNREDKVIKLWEVLEKTTMVTIRDIQLNTGYKRKFIRHAIELINKRGEAFYLWDENSDIVMEGRIHSLRVATIKVACNHCGANANYGTNINNCLYCGALINVDIKKHVNDNPPLFSRQEERTFSPVIFIVLLILFWPIALLYAAWMAGYLSELMASEFIPAALKRFIGVENIPVAPGNEKND